MIRLYNYIAGMLQPAHSGAWMNSIEPATGQVFAELPDSDELDVEAAVLAAQKAFPSWKNTPAAQRAAYLYRLADLIDQRADELVAAESMDNGKPEKLASHVDIPRASANLRFYAGAVLHTQSESFQTDQQALNYTYRQPLGVVGCISPWNLPLYLFTWKIAPALATGNTVVAKPSEITPYTAYLFSELCREAGLPDGVLNIVHGRGAKVGEAIVVHPGVKAVSFTGGTATGKRIASLTAPVFKKLSLELGGKNPNIVFDDANLQEAVSTSVHSSFSNQGEICLCGSRIFVQRGIYETFKENFLEKVSKLSQGDPKDPASRMGALVSKEHMEKVLSYIALAKEEGGKVLCGGERLFLDGRCAEGYFVKPTVIEGLSFDCRTNTEEIFGPVVTLIPFETEEEVIQMANATSYGLSATIWTENLKRAHRVAHQIESGIVWVNCWLLRDLRTPFGGMKASGMGREGGEYALDFYTEIKNICIGL